MDKEQIMKYLIDAHVDGQFNADCAHPSYSEARADTRAIADKLHKEINSIKDNWISVEDSMPENDVRVIGCTDYDGVLYDMLLRDGNWMTDCTRWSGDTVTHWQHDLQPPEIP